MTQVQPITDLLCRKWGSGTSGDEAFPHILKSRGVAAELPSAWCPLGGDAGSRQTLLSYSDEGKRSDVQLCGWCSTSALQ